MHAWLYRILAGAAACVCFYFSAYLGQSGFDSTRQVKQLERIVPSSIIGVLPGSTQVKGFVQPLQQQALLKSTRQKVPSVYFRYLKERKEKDSDGNTTWVTEQDISRAIDFTLVDQHHDARVRSANMVHKIKWSMPPSYTETIGSYRYTEWRLEPDYQVTVFGLAEISETRVTGPDIEIRFDTNDAYLPIISRLGAGEERASLGSEALLRIWAGISLLAFGVCGVMYLLQIHRLLTYLSIMTVITSGVLLSYALAAVNSDVATGHAFLDSKQTQAEQQLRTLLHDHSLEWRDWNSLGPLTREHFEPNSWQAKRIQEIRLNLFYLRRIYQRQISTFPESLYASFLGLDTPSSLSFLAKEEKEIALERLERYEPTTIRETKYLVLSFGGAALFIVAAYLGFRWSKMKRMIENVPTSKTRGVAVGITELKGRVQLIEDNSLRSPLTYSSSVWFRYLVKEKQRSGKDSKWVTIEDTEQGLRFLCEDREGTIDVDPARADMITCHKKSKRIGDRQYTEWVLKARDPLYVLGRASPDRNSPQHLVIGKPGSGEPFIISNYTEQELMMRKAIKAMVTLTLAFSGIFFFSIFINGTNGQFSALDYVTSGLLGPLFLMGFTAVMHYNDIVFLKHRTERNWHNIQVSLKKRADLFKQLQKVVEKYLEHEKDLLNRLAKLRAMSKKRVTTTGQARQRLTAEQRFTDSLSLRMEAYPDMKADQVVRDFFNTMNDLENEIALMRHGFNDAVRHYNTRIESFPDLILSKLFKFKRVALFTYHDGT